MGKIYNSYMVEEKIEELGGAEANESHMREIGYSEAFCGTQYRRANAVGIMMAIFQQTTGINVIFLYSNTVFANIGWKPQKISGIIGIVNWLTTIVGILLLVKYGRRILMLYGNFFITITLCLTGVFSLMGWNVMVIAMTFAFISFFEFTSGPITWLYMSEILQDKTQSIATMLNWSVNLGISWGIPHLLEAIGDDKIGYIFLFFGIFTAFATVFVYFFMLETKGKTPGEIEEMYSSDK